jgi:oligopeptidase A
MNNLSYPHFNSIEADQVIPAVTQTIQKCEEQLCSLEDFVTKNEVTWENFLVSIEKIERQFDAVCDPIEHLLSVKNSEELRLAHEQVQAQMVAFRLRISQSETIFDALKRISASPAFASLSPARRRAIELRIKYAKLAGLELKGAARERFNEISKELSKLSMEFSNNVLDATKSYKLVLTSENEVEGLSDSLKSLAADAYNRSDDQQKTKEATKEDGPWLITLEAPFYIPFMKYSARRDLREKLYKAYISRASSGNFDNTSKIYQILNLREELAGLLGFKTYADYSLYQKMAQRVEAVDQLIDSLIEKCMPFARKDYEELKAFASSLNENFDLALWDVPYYAEKLREHKFKFSEEELRPYFPLPKVLEGLFALINTLFDVTIQKSTKDVENWHPDVEYFDVLDKNHKVIAGFYIDLYSRASNKRGGAWMNHCLTKGYVDGLHQIPVAYLVCNFSPPLQNTPSLLTFMEVTTLFHEFGHGLQHMLTSIDDWGVSGISGIEWDAVELPSQFMENWCYQKDTLGNISGHFQTGKPIPDELYDKICAAKNFRAASDMTRQLHYAALDIELHHRYSPEKDGTVFDINQKIAQKTSVIPPLESDRFLCSFSHIFAGGYAAGYFSYKWAEVLSADAFAAFEEAEITDQAKVKEIGLKFRDTILALGGSLPPSEVYVKFRGRAPAIDALLRHSGLLQTQ